MHSAGESCAEFIGSMLHTRLTPATGFSASTLHPHRGHLILLCAEFGVEEVIVAQVSQCSWYGVWCGAGGGHFLVQ